MRTPIGEVHFIHPTPFYTHYQSRGDGFGGAQAVTNGECGLQKVNGVHVVVAPTEPVERVAPSPEPSPQTRAHYDERGWPWAGLGRTL